MVSPGGRPVGVVVTTVGVLMWVAGLCLASAHHTSSDGTSCGNLWMPSEMSNIANTNGCREAIDSADTVVTAIGIAAGVLLLVGIGLTFSNRPWVAAALVAAGLALGLIFMLTDPPVLHYGSGVAFIVGWLVLVGTIAATWYLADVISRRRRTGGPSVSC